MTEQEVNRAALSALRTYYRLRVKEGVPEIISDQRGAGGIIADGAYSFIGPNSERFLATVEATSADTRNEVYYQLQKWLLLWDSAAVASALTLLLFGWTFLQGYIYVKTYGIWLTACGLLSAFLAIGAFFYYIILRRGRRYRYIYAVEQFKRYHADEQWIAIGEDVFQDQNDPYLIELRNQCIYNGFGLISVDRQLKPHLLITPARHELFSGSRQVVEFFSQRQIQRILQQGEGLRRWWKKFSQGLPLQFTPADPDQLLRFRRPVFHQMAICGLSWLMISGIFYVQWQQRPIRYVNQETYEAEVMLRQAQSQPEPNRPIILTSDSIYVRPFEPQAIPYLLLLQSEALSPATAKLNQNGNGVLTGLLNGAMIRYDCARLYNFRITKFILQEGVYPDFERASRRMNQLLAAGLPTNCIWMGCFSDKDKSYIVYLDEIFDSREQAQSLVKNYRQHLQTKNLNASIVVRALVPPP